jgi:hypothetical protein
MPSVTVTQPSVIKVRVDGESTKVKTIGYNQSVSIKNAVDVDVTNASSGDVLTYDAETKKFVARPVGSGTQFSGSLVPSADQLYDLGSSTNRWRSLYVSGQTVYLGSMVISQEPTTGSVALTPAPTEQNPDPKGIMITPTGNFIPVTTIEGKPIPNIDYISEVANTIAYQAFSGYDAGFF